MPWRSLPCKLNGQEERHLIRVRRSVGSNPTRPKVHSRNDEVRVITHRLSELGKAKKKVAP